ncbi:hypothetical protein [Alienimonas californiensis]|uniref:Stigma-specific protein, Stig1 n=1 Tax=Alienimonas californiensis TaxID=2527989 RepID=A0A517PAH9_9PLAN|nr:hypothetical protein [Alienimonas californiensis]QDT16372.1 hypothetical protein CA12_24730 [Alienimonas californiensis]
MKMFSLVAVAALCCSGSVANAGLFGHGDASCAAPCAPTCAAPAYSTCDTGCTSYAPSYNYCCEKPSLCERLFGGAKKGFGLFDCFKKDDCCCQPTYCAPTCAAPCGDVCGNGCGDVCGAVPTCAAPCASSCGDYVAPSCAAPCGEGCGDACGNGAGYVAPTCAAPCGCN